jgi:hypothetical protein
MYIYIYRILRLGCTGSAVASGWDRQGSLREVLSHITHTDYYICVLRWCWMALLPPKVYFILLHMCPRTAIYVSSYYYICVLILLYMCPQVVLDGSAASQSLLSTLDELVSVFLESVCVSLSLYCVSEFSQCVA